MLRNYLIGTLIFLSASSFLKANELEQVEYELPSLVAESPEDAAPISDPVAAEELSPAPEPIVEIPLHLKPEEIPPPPAGMPGAESTTRRPAIPLEEQKFEKRFEVEIGTSFLPYDALYKPMLIETSMNWEFAKDWIWEIGRFGWAVTKFSSGLRDQVYSDLRNELQNVEGVDIDSLNVLEGDEMKHLRFVAGGSMAYRLFQGQVKLARKKDFQHEWLLRAGGAYLNFKKVKDQAGPLVGAEIRFRFDDHFDARLNADQVIGVMSKRQRSIGIFGIGFGYRF